MHIFPTFRTCVGLVLLFAPFFTGCANLKTRKMIAEAAVANRPVAEAPPAPAISEPVQSSDIEIDPPVAAVVQEPSEKVTTGAVGRIPVELNSHVKKWIEYFTVKDRARFQRILDRGQTYRDVVENVLEENDLPAELYYLAMIESGYRTNAHSHAQAMGVWQFIAGTGKRYGLRIDSHVDERRDPIRATEAAAKYLRDLYNVFGSWHLAMAAYNAGEIRILRAVMKGRTRNFWELSDAKRLPSETANYVPKFLAVVMIGQDPGRYGFTTKKTPNPYPSLEAASVPGATSLKAIALKTNTPLALLNRVNPHLNFGRAPANSRHYEVWVPSGKASVVARLKWKPLPLVVERTVTAKAKTKSHSRAYHVVRRGENLSLIAHRYKVSVGHLMRINSLGSTHVLAGVKLRVQAKSYRPLSFVKYKVRRGDNLTILARKFKTSPKRIKTQNKLKRSQIFVGQYLKFEPVN